jgi:hypothetical protein
MMRDKKGNVYFIAAPDEEDYSQTVFTHDTKLHWQYRGKHATQYWIKENPHKELKGVITGRFTYWASEAPIPGGISIENLELNSPFKNGEKFIFGITPFSPQQFIGKIQN